MIIASWSQQFVGETLFSDSRSMCVFVASSSGKNPQKITVTNLDHGLTMVKVICALLGRNNYV